MATYRLSDYHFSYPPGAVALEPSEKRDHSRLLVMPRASASPCEISHFYQLPHFLQAGDCLILNDVRVLPVRLQGLRSGGGHSEILLIADEKGQPLDDQTLTAANDQPMVFQAMISRGRKIRVGSQLVLQEGYSLEVLKDLGEGLWLIRIRNQEKSPKSDLLSACGEMPLPPYLERKKAGKRYDDMDQQRYQCVFAQKSGAIAAPTAGLHFTKELLSTLQAKGVEIYPVTLYVSYGTFEPIRSEDFRQHRMHEEFFEISENTAQAVTRAKLAGRRVLAVGTTVVRALESATTEKEDRFVLQAGKNSTQLFIHTDYQFRAVDGLITNFHLPQSSLLLLVCAFAGRERVLQAYQEAIAKNLRLFSYGDAMLIL